jgi:hypothetical protein
MSHPDEEFGSTLRQLLLDTAKEIHPTRPAPPAVVTSSGSWQQSTVPAIAPPRAKPLVPRFLVISFAVAIIIAAVALTVSLRVSSRGPAGSGASIPGALVVVRSNGAVDLINPNNGTVVKTLVGSSPTVAGGKHLGIPVGVTAHGNLAYVTYGTGSDLGAIYSVPLTGGHLSYVAAGMVAALSEDGSMLAYVRIGPNFGSGSRSNSAFESGSLEEIVVRNLQTGSERTVYDPSGTVFFTGLSWSEGRSELLVSGIYENSPTANGPLPGFSERIGVLSLDASVSTDNPRFISSYRAQSSGPDRYDPNFIGAGQTVGVLSNVPSAGCDIRSTSILTLDAVTGGVKTLLGTVPFDASDVQFSASGQPVAVTGFQPKCVSAVTTTTLPPTSTTLSRIPVETNASTGSSGGGTFGVVGQGSNSLSLYKWENGGAVKIASGVDQVAYVQSA